MLNEQEAVIPDDLAVLSLPPPPTGGKRAVTMRGIEETDTHI
jgi:hypothetical protein